MEKTSLKLGFAALLDAAPLLVAHERGFFAEQGLTVELLRQPSWAAVRDKVAVGALDGAQMPAPMTLAAALGLGGLAEPLVTALSLNLGGNAITLSNRLAETEPKYWDKPSFAVVHPFSGHHYELRIWLTAMGLDPDRDIRLLIVPPAQMLSHLSAGAIDGYCVGEPWNSAAAAAGLGRIAVTSHQLWAGRIEKVLGVRQSWAERYPETHRALLRALLRAALWCDQEDNRGELAELMARPGHVNAPAALLRSLLEGANAPIFHRSGANFPWRDQGHWYLDQMRKAGQIGALSDAHDLVDRVFRSDLTHLACLDLDFPAPAAPPAAFGEMR